MDSHSPYYGQAAFFKFFSPEKIPAAIERYEKEILRVLGVLDGVLVKKQWLVGGKYSAADISFVTCAFMTGTSSDHKKANRAGLTGGTMPPSPVS